MNANKFVNANVVIGLLCGACSQSNEPSATPSEIAKGGHGGALSSAGSAGSAGTGSSEAGAGGARAGTGGNAQSDAGASGSAGLPPGCEELGSPGKTGRQCDPGQDGDGTHDQSEPEDAVPPEAEGDRDGALSSERTFESSIYGYGFRYRVYVPKQYEAGKPAALMIFQDAGNYLANFRAPRVIDSLIADGDMPVTIGLFIEPGQQRSVEYDTRSDKYGKFLLEEILPEVVLSEYDIVDDPNGWAIGGHSSGGACAFNVAWYFPDKFRKIMTHMGSFVGLQDPGNDDYIRIVKEEDSKPLRVNLLSGTNDLGGDTWFNANNRMAESLDTTGYAYRYMKSTTSHDPTPWASADFPEAMRWLFRGYTLPHYS